MNSKEIIKNKLKEIAVNRNLTGEAVDVIIDLLTYSLYHEQIEISNTAKEMSLNDAKLINSKISLCCNYMYSVYRGRNPRVKLMVRVNSIINKSGFELVYESNTFKLYTEEQLSLVPSETPTEVELILSHKNIVTKSININSDNMYYVDLVDSDGTPWSNISEDIKVSIETRDSNNIIETKEYLTTRIFSDHCKSYGDDEKIFVLTIPDYGVRLFKKNNFDINSTVYIRALQYTTINDFNNSELAKITIPGTLTLKNEDYENETYEYESETERQNSKSLLYQANYAGRVNHEIQSNSDVSYLFNEVYIDCVESSTYRYDIDGDKTLHIRYLKKEHPQGSVNSEEFREHYAPYYIKNTLDIQEATAIEIEFEIVVITEDTTNVYDDVIAIINKYNRKLDLTLNEDLIKAEITKIPSIIYISKFVGNYGNHIPNNGSGYDKYYDITVNLKFYRENGTVFES